MDMYSRPAALLVATAMAVATLAAGYLGESAPAQTTQRPNVIFILTDDQDAESIRHMPTVQRELIQKGTTFENGILTLTECCPSRATMLGGQYAHNHSIGLGVGANTQLQAARVGNEHGGDLARSGGVQDGAGRT